MDPSLRTLLNDRGLQIHGSLAGGYQSTVYSGALGDRHVVVKVVDARWSEPEIVLRQAELAGDLAAIDPRVVAPIAIGGDLLLVIGDHLITVLPRVAGHSPDLDNERDARWLGKQLARLHLSLAQVSSDLPPVASLRVPGNNIGGAEEQLIHGDPGAANFLRDGDDAHVLDLGEAGFGTRAYDVSLALFSRRFEVWSRDARRATGSADDQAPRALIDGYEDEVGHPLSSDALLEGLRLRRGALAWWLNHLQDAPVGIRTASPEWRDHLARFVDDDRRTRR